MPRKGGGIPPDVGTFDDTGTMPGETSRKLLDGRHPGEGATTVINIYVSSRSLAAARSVDPDVSPAAVHAAVEVAITEHMRQQGPRPEQSDRAGDRDR